MTNLKIKICGLKTREALTAAENAGADFAGFVFFEKSPRNIAPEDAAPLVRATKLTTVGLFVDPTDDDLRRVLKTVPLRAIQLHGNETMSRVAAIKTMTGLDIIKALRIATADDLMFADSYARVADWLLFDAKTSHALPGGTGQNFDWALLKNFKINRPWMLAGGLNTENIGDALKLLQPNGVDVSSGVESQAGVKDPGKIAAFIDKVRHA